MYYCLLPVPPEQNLEGIVETNKPQKKKRNCYRIHSCVLSSHFNAVARGGVSYNYSYSSQRKTVSQGQYQGSPAIGAIVSSDGGEGSYDV
jgi:hypothetical protein